MPSPQKRDRTRCRVPRLAIAAALAALGLTGAGFGLWWAVRWIPPFYRQAMQQPHDPAAAALAREELSSRLLDIYNRRWDGEPFLACFRQEALNAALAGEVPDPLPTWWPHEVRQMRVAIAQDRIWVGMHYQLGPVASVLWAEGEMYLTPHDNELALRWHRLRLGAIPLPPSVILDKIAHSLQQAGLAVRWSEVAQNPVLLVRLDHSTHAEHEPHLVLEQLALKTGAVELTGRWVRTAAAASLAPATSPSPAESPAAAQRPAAAGSARDAAIRDPQVPPTSDGSEEVSSTQPTLQVR